MQTQHAVHVPDGFISFEGSAVLSLVLAEVEEGEAAGWQAEGVAGNEVSAGGGGACDSAKMVSHVSRLTEWKEVRDRCVFA